MKNKKTKDSSSIEQITEVLSSAKNYDELKCALDAYPKRHLKGITKKLKRWTIERLISFDSSYHEAWRIANYAQKLDYTLTERHKMLIVGKLVNQANSKAEFKKVKDYARQESMLSVYLKFLFNRRVSDIIYEH